MGGRFLHALRQLVANGPSDRSASGLIEQWINIQILQKLVHHTSTVIAAVILFWFVGFVLRKLLHDGFLKRAVLLLDEFVLFLLFAFLAWEILAGLLHRILQGGA